VYPVITEPPLLDGADHVTTTCVLPRVPLTLVGTSGVVIGVTDADADEELESPAALAAMTVNVYAVPFVRPVTVQLRATAVVHVFEPGLEVTVYLVIAEPPLLDGADQLTVA